MDKRFLAVCVMTYEHPQTVDKTLMYWNSFIDELGFDLYYFDSSKSDETMKIVNKYQKQSDHIFYIRIPSDVSADNKFLIPYDGSNLPYEYRYLWPVKDRIVPDIALIVSIYQELIMGCDILQLSYNDEKDLFKKDDPYENISKEEFYRDYAWVTTDFCTTIYNYETILANFNPNEIINNYFFEENMEKKCYFPHTATLFHYMAKMKKPKICIIKLGDKNKTIHSTSEKSGWRDSNIGIDIFGNYWPKVNRALPSVYDAYKREAIRKETNISALFGSVDGLISLHFSDKDSHIYSDHMLLSWNDYSDIPVEIARDISNGDFTSAYNLFSTKFECYIKTGQIENLSLLCHFNKWIKSLTPFCNDKEKSDIYDNANAYFINKLSNDSTLSKE